MGEGRRSSRPRTSTRRTAYAAINTLRLDDLRPHILRTRDGGKTLDRRSPAAFPTAASSTSCARTRSGADCSSPGTEQAVYVSFDDGEHWQSLRLNMPATSIRDLVVKDDDLVVGDARPRVLDPRRHRAAAAAARAGCAADAHLFKPQTALRFRWNKNTDTPLPPDEPPATEPARRRDHRLLPARRAAGAGHAGDPRRRAAPSCAATPAPTRRPRRRRGQRPALLDPPPQPLSGDAGLHRFVWDLHYAPPPSLEPGYSIAAIPHDTPREPRGPWAMPGSYTVRLTAGSTISTRPLTVVMDPRVKTPLPALRQQFELSQELADALRQDIGLVEQVREARRKKPEEKDLAALEGTVEERRPWAAQQPRSCPGPPAWPPPTICCSPPTQLPRRRRWKPRVAC